MKKGILAVAVVVIFCACGNSSAEYNNQAYMVYSSYQNILNQLGEKLGSDSVTNDSAIQYINYAQNMCDSQLLELKKIKVPKNATEFHSSLEKLLMQQQTHLTIQKRLYNDSEPGKDFSELSDSLDINQALIDTLDARTKSKQLEFAKANGFKLQ